MLKTNPKLLENPSSVLNLLEFIGKYAIDAKRCILELQEENKDIKERLFNLDGDLGV